MSQQKSLKKPEEQVETEGEWRLPARFAELPPSKVMAGMQVFGSAPGRYMTNDNVKNLLATGALDLYSAAARRRTPPSPSCRCSPSASQARASIALLRLRAPRLTTWSGATSICATA